MPFFCRPSLRLCVRPSSQPSCDHPFFLLPLCRSMMELNYRRVPRWNRRHAASEQARVVTVHAIIVRELQWRPRANIGTREIACNALFRVRRKGENICREDAETRSKQLRKFFLEKSQLRAEFSARLRSQKRKRRRSNFPFAPRLRAVAANRFAPSLSLPYSAVRLHLTCPSFL